MKSIRFIALISAAAMCFGLCACGKSEKKDEIAVPILETKDITYKTVKAEIGDISQEYHQEFMITLIVKPSPSRQAVR